MKRVYKELEDLSKNDYLQIVASGEIPNICEAIVRAAHSIQDQVWLLDQFKLMIEHPELEVRAVTVTSLGHLARLNGDLKRLELLQILQPLLTDPDLVGRVEDAIEDIDAYL